MKALSLTQPYATLVAIGAKKIETRSWATRWRGLVAIHAAAKMPDDLRNWCVHAPVMSKVMQDLTGTPDWMDWMTILLAAGTKKFPFPLGMVVATARIAACLKIPEQLQAYSEDGQRMVLLPPEEPELSFGCYAAGRYAWILEDVQKLAEPVPAKGALGLWEWEGMAG